MTIFPSILLILLLLVSPTFGDTTPGIRDSCKGRMEEARRAFAKQKKIANMNELEYDLGLEKTISELEPGQKCVTYSTGLEYDVASSPDLDDLGDSSLSLDPTRTKFACSRITCDTQHEYQFIADKPLGMANNYIDGTPGSKCPKGRVNKDGLCAKSNTMNSESMTSKPENSNPKKTESKKTETDHFKAEDDTKDSGSAVFSLIILPILMAIFYL